MELKPVVASAMFAAFLGAAPQSFAALSPLSPDYVYDSAGQVVHDNEGDCVHTSEWSAKRATVQCDPGLFKHPAVTTPMPKPAPKTAVNTYGLMPVASVEPKAAVSPKEERLTLTGDATFGFDKSNLTAKDRERLDKLIARVKASPDVTSIRVTGYTDNVGKPEYNMRLSLRRAEAAQRYLIDHGIDPKRIVIVGMGEADPVASNGTPAGRARNRRAEIDIHAEQNVASNN
ncbi:MAG TPA: OmpA family protein [Candidatus Methylomirabilis sp.]|nr:OmpA family protein [Candidatus Methylomirabilis sp.]